MTSLTSPSSSHTSPTVNLRGLPISSASPAGPLQYIKHGELSVGDVYRLALHSAAWAHEVSSYCSTSTALAHENAVHQSYPGKVWRRVSDQLGAGDSGDVHQERLRQVTFARKIWRYLIISAGQGGHCATGRGCSQHGAGHPRGVERCRGVGALEYPVGDAANAITRSQHQPAGGVRPVEIQGLAREVCLVRLRRQ